MRAVTCLVIVACMWLSLLAPDAFADTVSAPGGVAAGGDIRDTTISITGISPEQLAVITEALKREQKLTDDQRKIIVDLEGKLGVSTGALQAFFGILGEADVPPEKQPERLVEIAEDYNRVRQQVAAAPGDPPAVAGLKAEARAALDAGELSRADDLLAQVLAAEDAAIEQRRLEAARTSAQRGDIALTRLRYLEAAEHFAAAAARVPASYDDQRLAYLDQEADAYYRQGHEFGDNDALIEAIHHYRALLVIRLRARVPLDWAMTQNNLGTALATLGERTGDRAKLEEARNAVAAAFDVVMEAGQEQYRGYFEDRLGELDRQIAGLNPPRR